jgi:hypothetical protein
MGLGRVASTTLPEARREQALRQPVRTFHNFTIKEISMFPEFTEAMQKLHEELKLKG